MPAVTVVIISFNGRQHLDECLRSVLAADGPIHEVILVDDGSSDGTAEFVRECFPSVRVVRLERNAGPSVARNAGLEAARTALVCLLDNDLRVDEGWLPPLMDALAARDDVAVCASRILIYEKPELIGTDGDDAHYVGMPTRRHAWARAREVDDSAPAEIGAAPGISLLVDKARLGPECAFDPDYFYNFEDLDFCLNVRIRGRKCLVVPRSVVYHKYLSGGVAELTSNQAVYSARRAYYVFRNRWYVVFKFYAARSILVLAPALALFEGVSLVFAVRRGVFGAYVRALGALVRAGPMLRAKRRAVQAARAVPDRLLLSACPLTLGRGTVGESAVEGRLAAAINGVLRAYWAPARRLI